jgi:hypothetical protein
MLGGSSYNVGGPIWDENAELAWGPDFVAELLAAERLSVVRPTPQGIQPLWLHPLSAALGSRA